MKKYRSPLWILTFLLVLIIGIKINNNKIENNESQIEDLVVLSPHPFSFIEPLVNRFEAKHGIRIKIVSKGSLELLESIKTSEVAGDIFWGGSLTTLLSEIDYFEEYRSRNEEYVLKNYKNSEGKITRFTVVPSIIMINRNLAGDIKINGFMDLLKLELKSKIAVADPSRSSSSFEHLMNQLYATSNNSQPNWNYVDVLLRDMDINILDRSSEVYKGVAEGKFMIGCTFEEAAASYVRNGAPVEIVYPIEGTALVPDGVAIIKGSKNIDNAKLFIDFLSSKDTQTFIAQELNRRSVRKDVVVSKSLKSLSDIKIIDYDLNFAATKKDEILDKYSDLLLKYDK